MCFPDKWTGIWQLANFSRSQGYIEVLKTSSLLLVDYQRLYIYSQTIIWPGEEIPEMELDKKIGKSI